MVGGAIEERAAAGLVGAAAEPVGAELGDGQRHAVQRLADQDCRDRVAAVVDVQVPGRGVVTGDARAHWMLLEQGVEAVDHGHVVTGGRGIDDLAKVLGKAA